MKSRVFALTSAFVLLALSLPVVTGIGVSAALAEGTTVTGTQYAYNPATRSNFTELPSVTVDQTSNLTDQVVHVTWQNFTPSNNPTGPFFAQGNTFYAVTVLQCKGTNPVAPTTWIWPDFGTDCYPFTPDAATAEHGVGNEVYTITGQSGSGEAYFHVETVQENDFLGCDATHPCSLVVVPNFGGMQPIGQPIGAPKVNCADHSGDTSFTKGKTALDDHLGLACSWQDRIVVPLSFAPTPDNCAARDYAFAAEGAPLLARTIEQWQSGWCQGSSGLSFDYDSSTNEFLARQSFLSGGGALTSATDVAVVNAPASSGASTQRRYTYAPLVNSAITVAYHVDDVLTGKLINNLNLDARLVAKLVTQSYSLDFGCLDGSTSQGPACDPAIKGNPTSIFDDPEFLALNPSYTRSHFPPASTLNRGQFLPLVISGTSDLVHQLTAWLDADPKAHAFLNGTADDWGMHVNTYYQSQSLPLDQFSNLDPGYTAPATNGVPGISTMQVSWNPITGLDNVASSLVIDRPSAINPTLPACGDGIPCVYGRFGSEAPGTRAMFAIVGLPDAAADRFQTANLVNAAGHAVGPTDDALNAGLAAMTTNADGITKTANLTSTDPNAYPLTVTEYGMIPTCGLTSAKVAAVQSFLTKAGSSQTVGLAPGQLSPGAVPLTSAQRAQTASAGKAASTVACSSVTPGPPVGGIPSGGSTGFGGGGGGGGSAAADAKAHSIADVKANGGGSDGKKKLVAFGVKGNDSSNSYGVILPAVLILGFLLVLAGPGAFWVLTTDSGARVRTWLFGKAAS